MEACMHELAERVLRPLVEQLLYPDLAGPLTHHHSFIVRLHLPRSAHACVLELGPMLVTATLTLRAQIKNASWESDSFQLWKYVDEESGEPTSRHVDDSVVTFNMCLGADRFDGNHLTRRHTSCAIAELTSPVSTSHARTHSTHARTQGCELRFYGDKRDHRYRLDRYFEFPQVSSRCAPPP
jgi:GH24 family phage-related lysozyme (muramidase)